MGTEKSNQTGPGHTKKIDYIAYCQQFNSDNTLGAVGFSSPLQILIQIGLEYYIRRGMNRNFYCFQALLKSNKTDHVINWSH